MEKREEILEKLKSIKQEATLNLQHKSGYENYEVRNVKYYGKVGLVSKVTGEKEEFDLHVIEISEKDNKLGEIELIYYLNGKEIDFTDLIKEYESPEPIKDVIDKANENKEKPEEEQDKDLEIQDLNELEKESKEEKEENDIKQKDKNITKNKNSMEKPKYVIQTVDVDQAYVDKLTTLRKALNLPSEVKELAFSYPNSEQDRKLSDDLTVNMLDSSGKIINETKDGKKITDILEVDDSTGNNPMNDENTKLELKGYAEKNEGLTLKRFKSKVNPDMYLSVEQKKIGGYAELYAGGKTHDGNEAVECQLETDNVEIQTSLEMQEIIDGRRGVHSKDAIDKEADFHVAHGDDESKIAKENADGDDKTAEVCENKIDTNFIDTCVQEILKNDAINDTYKEREVREYLVKTIQENPEKELKEVKEIVEYDLDMTSREINR